MTLFNRLRDWSRRRALRRRLDEELAFHRDELAAEFMRRGLPLAEARRQAERELGNTTLVQEAHRERAGLPWLEEWLRDSILALRNLRRRPGYAVTVIGLLGVGLAAALTVFVLTDAMLRRALPVPQPEELHLVMNTDQDLGRFSRATADRLRERLPNGVMIAYGGDSSVTVQRGAAPAKSARGQLVAGDALGNLGVRAVAGRLLTPADDRIGEGQPVMVVSYRWATREFGSATAAVGQELQVNLQTVQIVGVLDPDFQGFDVVDSVDLFMPTAMQLPLRMQGNARIFGNDDRPNDPDWNRENRVSWLTLLLRLPRSLAPEQARAQLMAAVQPDKDDLISQLQSPVEREGVERRTWTVEPAPGGFSYDRTRFAGTGRMLFALVGSLLLLTCANLSGIMLVRTLARHREIGVRLSLGAGTWRACRLAVIEALMGGLLGAGLGLLLASWLLPQAADLLVPGATLSLEIAGWQEIGVLVALAVLTSLACALAPAWWISRLEPLVASKGLMGGGLMPKRLGRVLVSLQLALAVMLVAVAMSLAEEITTVLETDPGFDREEVLTARFNPSTAGYQEEQLPALYNRLRQSALEVPGVEQVGLSMTGILAGSRSRSGIFPRGEGLDSRADDYQQDPADIHYLDTVGLRLLRGRWFNAGDHADAPQVAVVSEALARKLWNETDVIGRRFGYSYEASDEDMTVIGVVADAGINRAREAATEIFFTAAEQTGAPLGFMAVRVRGNVKALRESLRSALASAEPGLVFSSWLTLEERREGNLRSEIASSRLAMVVAGVALALAAFGVGGALAHIVALRQRELAVRAALGATPARLRGDVLGDSLRLGLWGVGGGLVLVGLAAVGVPLIGWWNAKPQWTVALLAAAFGLGAALLGGWWPARRASRVDPQRMLKAE